MSEFSAKNLPPLEWLRVFEASARHGGFTAAAREIGLTQAAVSQRIQGLESHLGVQLFLRLPRGVQLTADGEAYVPHVRDALNQLRRSTHDLFGTRRKYLSIAAPASVSTLWIAPRLAGLAVDQPGLQITLSSIHRSLDYAATDTDYQVRFGTGDWTGYEAALMYRETLVPACAPALLKNGADWRSLPTLAVKGPRDGWADWADAVGEPLVQTPHFRFDSFITALEAAKAGAGLLLASLPLAHSALTDGTLVGLSDQNHVMAAGAWLIWPETLHKTRDHQIVLEALCAS